MTKTKEVAIVDEVALAELKDMYPVEQGFQRIYLPRIIFISQDQTEGKGKTMTVTTEAGTFFTEILSEETGADGKKVWVKEEIGSAFECTVFYNRKQLKFFDEAADKFTSSSIYDSEDEQVTLWCDKKEVATGLPKELKDKYKFVDKDGKNKSKLEENRIIYILYKGEMYQMNLRGSSMYSFLTWSRKVLPPSLLVAISSEPKEKGSIEWNQMTFTPVRNLTTEEVRDVIEKTKAIREGIMAEKSFFSKKAETVINTEKEFQNY